MFMWDGLISMQSQPLLWPAHTYTTALLVSSWPITGFQCIVSAWTQQAPAFMFLFLSLYFCKIVDQQNKYSKHVCKIVVFQRVSAECHCMQNLLLSQFTSFTSDTCSHYGGLKCCYSTVALQGKARKCIRRGIY